MPHFVDQDFQDQVTLEYKENKRLEEEELALA